MRSFTAVAVLAVSLAGCASHERVRDVSGPRATRVPDVRGLEIPYAVARIHRAGLRAATAGYRCDESKTHQRYAVLGQRPKPGALTSRGRLVILRLDFMHSQGVRVPLPPLRPGRYRCR